MSTGTHMRQPVANGLAAPFAWSSASGAVLGIDTRR